MLLWSTSWNFEILERSQTWHAVNNVNSHYHPDRPKYPLKINLFTVSIRFDFLDILCVYCYYTCIHWSVEIISEYSRNNYLLFTCRGNMKRNSSKQLTSYYVFIMDLNERNILETIGIMYKNMHPICIWKQIKFFFFLCLCMYML